MNATTHHRGIAGLEGREPVGVVLSVGRKNERGFPVENDRFHLVVPREENGKRPGHSAFAAFNGAPAERRKVIRGVIVHANEGDAFDYALRCQVGKGSAHPNRLPFCQGDGATATRWVGPNADDFKEIACPHDRCEFRQSPGKNKPTPCKPFGRLLFHLTWPEETQAALVAAGRPPLPAMLAKYQTGSWHTVRNLIGFFEHVRSAARGLRIESPSLFGLPFTLTLTRQTKPSETSSFPVVTITPTMEPAEFFLRQRDTMDRLAYEAPRAALTHDDERDPVVVAEDYRTITPGLPVVVEETAE